MKKLVRLLAALPALSTPALAQQQSNRQVFACMEQNSAGFHADTRNNYQRSNFTPERFTMVFEPNEMRVTIKINGNESSFQCSQPWSTSPELIQCIASFSFIGIDRNTWSFTRGSFLGPLGGGAKDSLSIGYGDCQRF